MRNAILATCLIPSLTLALAQAQAQASPIIQTTPWWITLITVAVGGLIAFAASWGKDLLVAERQRKKDAFFLAVRVGMELEAFAETCLAVAYDDGGPEDDDGRRASQIRLPKFEPLKIEVEWRSIDQRLLCCIFQFPISCSDASARLYDEAENGDWPPGAFYFANRQKEYSMLGLRALDIAKNLRDSANINSFDLEQRNIHSEFHERIEIAKRLIKRIEASGSISLD